MELPVVAVVVVEVLQELGSCKELGTRWVLEQEPGKE